MPPKPGKPIVGISTCMDAGKTINPERTYQYLEISYADALAEAGAIPVIIPYLRDASQYSDLFDGLDGLLISGGEDLLSGVPGETPAIPLDLTPDCRLEQDRALLECALGRGLPLLGICYGMQIINLHLGGSIYYDIPHQLPSAGDHKPGTMTYRHDVILAQGSRLRKILCGGTGTNGAHEGDGRISANSSHHQSVRDTGEGLSVCGECADGIIEAIESESSHFIIGVQWHPEKMEGEDRRKFFAAFVEACAESRRLRSGISGQ